MNEHRPVVTGPDPVPPMTPDEFEAALGRAERVTDTESGAIGVLLSGPYNETSFWAADPAFRAGFVQFSDPDPATGERSAHVAWREAVAALDAGTLSAPPVYQRVLRLAASLAVGTPVDLHDCIRPMPLVGAFDIHNIIFMDGIRGGEAG